MKPESLSIIKAELKHMSQAELLDLCLALAKYKVENKEFLSFLVFESNDLVDYRNRAKAFIEQEVSEINQNTLYFAKKGLRKVLKTTKKLIKFSKDKQTEVELLLCFCTCMHHLNFNFKRYSILENMYLSQLRIVSNAIDKLHEDLQYDYGLQYQELMDR